MKQAKASAATSATTTVCTWMTLANEEGRKSCLTTLAEMDGSDVRDREMDGMEWMDG